MSTTSGQLAGDSAANNSHNQVVEFEAVPSTGMASSRLFAIHGADAQPSSCRGDFCDAISLM